MNFEEKVRNAKTVLGSSQGKEYLSDFWRKILDNRNNFPEGDALREFFRFDYAKGYGTILGDTPEKTFRMLVDTFVKDTPKDFLLEFREPDFGHPQIFNYQDLNFSITYLQNIPTTYRIQCLPLGKQLRVLEIGAGYGGVAQQLHQILDIKKYTIIDLPESLYISYFYLSENTGRKSALSLLRQISLIISTMSLILL
jgi:putative sugar O-methyltransferase